MFNFIRKIFKVFVGIWFVGIIIFFAAYGVSLGIKLSQPILGVFLGIIVGFFVSVLVRGFIATIIHMSDCLDSINRKLFPNNIQGNVEDEDGESDKDAMSVLSKVILIVDAVVVLVLIVLVIFGKISLKF